MMKKTLTLALLTILVVIGILLFWRGLAEAPSHATSGTLTTTTGSTPKAPSFDKTQYSTTDPSSIWVVVNKQHPLNPTSYAPTDLTSVGNGQYMRAEAATALTSFFAGAKAAGYTLRADSGYRSYATQVATYNSEVKSFGQAKADSESARPGYSEHQTGWAVDIGAAGCDIEDCFGSTAEGRWAAANAYQYGFILRYTDANTSMTGYRAEAWHFRYVGTQLSNELHKENVTTLEQFFGITGGSTYK